MKNAKKVLAIVCIGLALAGCVQDEFEEIELTPAEIELQKATDDADPNEHGSIPPTSG